MDRIYSVVVAAIIIAGSAIAAFTCLLLLAKRPLAESDAVAAGPLFFAGGFGFCAIKQPVLSKEGLRKAPEPRLRGIDHFPHERK